MGLNSKYNKGKWEFIAKDQGGGSGWKLRRNIRVKREFGLNRPTRIRAEGRTGW